MNTGSTNRSWLLVMFLAGNTAGFPVGAQDSALTVIPRPET